jgi:hypothetical protein
VRNEASPHLASEPQASFIVRADEQFIDAVRSRTIATDHELLLVLKLQLLPGVAPLSIRHDGRSSYNEGSDMIRTLLELSG